MASAEPAQALSPEQAPSLTLGRAIEVLHGLNGHDQLQDRLVAIQDACTALVTLVERGGQLPTDLLENALEAVCLGLSCARAQLEAAAGQLAAVRAAAWSQAALAAADACLHSENWHAAWHGDAGAGGKEAYLRTVALMRDTLRDELLPLLGAAAAQQNADTGFCLAPQFQALLAMGCAAAEVVGMRDPRHRRPGLRNFSVLNVLWNGIQRLWVAVPAEARADMECQGLGACVVVQQVLGFIRKDVRGCHQLLDPGMGKLLQYWVQKAKFVLTDYPGAAPACWQPLLEVPVVAQRELALLAAAAEAAAAGSQDGGGAGAGATALAEALQGQVIPKAVALLGSCLGWATGEDQLRAMLDALRLRLSSSSSGDEAAQALRAVLHLLQTAPSMPPLARLHCVPLLGTVFETLQGPAFAAALGSAELRDAVVDAALTLLATCCHAAASAAGNAALQPCERQLVAQTWERCQQQLFMHALQPHPVTAQVLGALWSDLAAFASDALLQSHATLLHDLLRLVAAAEAAEGGHSAPSPLYMQLLGLLACLLTAAPAAMADAYFANFLQLLPPAHDDACQLTCLAAELRLATLVDAACGTSRAAQQVLTVLGSLYSLLLEAAPPVIKRLPRGSAAGEAEGGQAYLAWLLDALQCAVAYFASTGSQQAAGCEALAALPSRLILLLARAVSRGVFSFAAPALAALRDALALQVPLSPQDREQLLPVLSACLDQPPLAAVAAALTPAMAGSAAPHADLLHSALSARSPLLQHLGLEAFWQYAKVCPKPALAEAIPPSARNPETGFAKEGFASLLAQYTQRTAGDDAAPGEQQVAAWASSLWQEALGAGPALRQTADALRAAAADADAGEGDAEQAGPNSQPAEQQQQHVDNDNGSDAVGAVAAAVDQVAHAIGQLEAALSGGPPLDPATAHSLQQCMGCLAQLVGGASA